MKTAEIRKNLAAQRAAFLKSCREDYEHAKQAVSLAGRVSQAMAKALGREEIEVYSYYTGLSITVFETFADGFKDERLLAALEAVMDAMPESAISTSDAYVTSNMREYRFKVPGLIVEINAKLPEGGSDTCRRVKIGERVHIVDEFKFVCDEGAA